MACEEIQRTLSDRDGRTLRGRRVRAHLRDCDTCSTFAATIPERREALMALSPALPATAAARLLAKVTGASSAHHGGGGLLASASGKSMGLAASAKTFATGVAIVATAAAGTVGGVAIITHASHTATAGRIVGDSDRSASVSAADHWVPPRQAARAGRRRAQLLGAARDRAATCPHPARDPTRARGQHLRIRAVCPHTAGPPRLLQDRSGGWIEQPERPWREPQCRRRESQRWRRKRERRWRELQRPWREPQRPRRQFSRLIITGRRGPLLP